MRKLRKSRKGAIPVDYVIAVVAFLLALSFLVSAICFSFLPYARQARLEDVERTSTSLRSLMLSSPGSPPDWWAYTNEGPDTFGLSEYSQYLHYTSSGVELYVLHPNKLARLYPGCPYYLPYDPEMPGYDSNIMNWTGGSFYTISADNYSVRESLGLAPYYHFRLEIGPACILEIDVVLFKHVEVSLPWPLNLIIDAAAWNVYNVTFRSVRPDGSSIPYCQLNFTIITPEVINIIESGASTRIARFAVAYDVNRTYANMRLVDNLTELINPPGYLEYWQAINNKFRHYNPLGPLYTDENGYLRVYVALPFQLPILGSLFALDEGEYILHAMMKTPKGYFSGNSVSFMHVRDVSYWWWLFYFIRNFFFPRPIYATGYIWRLENPPRIAVHVWAWRKTDGGPVSQTWLDAPPDCCIMTKSGYTHVIQLNYQGNGYYNASFPYVSGPYMVSVMFPKQFDFSWGTFRLRIYAGTAKLMYPMWVKYGPEPPGLTDCVIAERYVIVEDVLMDARVICWRP